MNDKNNSYDKPVVGIPVNSTSGQPQGFPYPPPSAQGYPPPQYAAPAPVYYEAPPPPRTDLTCGIGLMWVLFIIGILLWPVWYVGACWGCVLVKLDARERSGWIANCCGAVILTILWIVAIAVAVPLS